MEHLQKARLPESELGEHRCFEIGYFGHGDIVMATWEGDLDHDPTSQDGVSKRFGMAHGSDVYILASFAGYLVRCGQTEGEVSEVMLTAGEKVARNNPDRVRFRSSINDSAIDALSSGRPYPDFDLPLHNRECLMPAKPSQPGLIEKVGGTGIYSSLSGGDKLLLSLVKFMPLRDAGNESVEVAEIADFCEADIPTMAKMVCDLALGEYELDIQYFLTRRYIDSAEGET